jgi:hypothetical protein
MSRIWAVARHMIAESLRMKIALVFLGIIVLILPSMPFAIAGDGVTLKSRVQSFLAYSLGSVGFLLSLLTVFLSAAALANEIRGKHIMMVASKPIPRWQFFAGKWLGIVTLNAAMLLLTGLTVWGFTTYLKTRPTSVPGDIEALTSEVLSARHSVISEKPDFSILVDERIRKLREEGRLENSDPNTEADLRRQIQEDLRLTWWSLGPKQGREFVFKNLLVDREQGWVHIRMKPDTPTAVDGLKWTIWYQAGDSTDPNTMSPERTMNDVISERFITIPISTQAVNADGTLYFRLVNLDPKNSMMFQGDDSFRLLYDLGTFHWNLFRALSVIWCRLAFLAIVGLTASAFLTFPVGCMACFLVLMVASSSGFLTEAIEWSRPAPLAADPFWLGRTFIRSTAHGFLWLVPDFSKFDPIENVVDGRVVPLMWVIHSFVILVLLKGLILGIIGGTIFTRREVAQVVV